MRNFKGSFTVEATLLMTILIPLLTALIYYGFFLHDCAWIQGAAYEQALEAALQDDENGANVTLSKSFHMPGLVVRFFENGTIDISANKKVKVIHAGERIIQMKALQNVMRGD